MLLFSLIYDAVLYSNYLFLLLPLSSTAPFLAILSLLCLHCLTFTMTTLNTLSPVYTAATRRFTAMIEENTPTKLQLAVLFTSGAKS